MRKSLFSLMFALAILVWILGSHADAFALPGKKEGVPGHPAPMLSATPAKQPFAACRGALRRNASSCPQD